MSTICHACGKPVEPSANRCRSCGRSLVAKSGTAAHTAAPAPVPGAATAKGAATATSAAKGTGAIQGAPKSANESGDFSDHIVNGIIALVTGVVSFALVALVLGRVMPDSAGGLTYALMFLLGFCVPAAYAFHHAHKKSQEAKDRKRFGLTRTSEFPDAVAAPATKAYVSPTRTNVPTPHYERTKMEYLAGGCTLDDGKVEEWRALLEPVPPEDQTIPRNYLFTSLEGGDAQPGIIVHSDAELVIASVYTDEFDSYIFIGFTGRERAKLESDGMSTVGTRLLCAWKYAALDPIGQTDIIRGKNNSNEFVSGEASIIDLISSDAKRIDYLKRMFGDKMYATVLDGSRQLLASGKVTRLRCGSPLIGSYAYMDYQPPAVANA